MALSKKATIGIIVGIVALLLLIMIIAAIFDKKRLKNEDKKNKEDSKDDKKKDEKEKKETPPSKTPQPGPQPKPVFKELPKLEQKKENTNELYDKKLKKITVSAPDLYREKVALPDVNNKKDTPVKQPVGKSNLTFKNDIKEHVLSSPPPSPPQPGHDQPPNPDPQQPIDPQPPSPPQPQPIKPVISNNPMFGTGNDNKHNILPVH